MNMSAMYMSEILGEMKRREVEMGIKPDIVIDAFLRAQSMEGHRHSIVTDLMLRILGLEVRGLH